MADDTPQIPPLIWSVARALAQKGVTALAVALTGYGVLAQDKQSEFTTYGVAAAVWAVSIGWTLVHEWVDNRTKKALRDAPPPPLPAVNQN